MTTQVPPLVDILAEIPDPRQDSGKRYPLHAMLTLVCVAVLCGYKSIKAIAEWGPNYGEDYIDKLGFNEHGYPAQASWYRVLGEVDVAVFEEKIREWVGAIMEPKDDELLGVSIDGKTLRISKKMGAHNSHVLSAVAHEIGVVMGQWPVDDKTNEIGMMPQVLLDLALEGCVVTSDGLLVQKDVVDTIVDEGGDYVMPIKDNHPTTRQAIAVWFDSDPLPDDEANATAQHTHKGHGRIVTRRIETTTALNDYLDWKGLAQTFRLHRRIVDISTGEIKEQTVYGITSLSPQQAGPEDLLTFVQQHWTIENKLHWVKDVIMNEDHCQLRSGHTHHVMALVRNTSLSLLRLSGLHQIASTFRTFAAQPDRAIDLVVSPIGEQ
jgi:predicted transposase YbfD/YdcC